MSSNASLDHSSPAGNVAPTTETAVEHTGSRATRTLGMVVLACSALLAYLSLVASPADIVQGDSVRLMYVHVPSAIIATRLAIGIMAIGSVMYLWKKSQFWDLMAASAAEIGALFCGLTLVTGMVWGKTTWGAYWAWDARLTSTALLFLLYLGYIAVRGLPADPGVRGKRSAIVALVAAIDVPIVYYSVEWWRSLHQQATISPVDTQLDGLMLFTFFFGVVTFSLGFVWLMIHRFRVAWLEEQIEEVGLEAAIAERRAEAERI